VWAKIEEFQKKGAAQNFKTAMDSNSVVIKVNNDLITQMEQLIAYEE
jgi:type II secretory pathway component GspD/PulD (secretin)